MPTPPPTKNVTAAQVAASKETGIAVGVNDQGLVVMFRLLEGGAEWGEEFEAEDALDIGQMLIEEARKAISRRAKH